MDNRLAALCAAGLPLVAIPPINGKPTKAPTSKGWNKVKNTDNPNGYSSHVDDFINCTGFNFGLYHGASNTLALDLDNVELARKVFEELTDQQLLDWLESDQRLEIKSPKPNRGKLLFKLPQDFEGAGLRQLKHNGAVIFELRCGNCQDVIVGQHPDGGAYQLIGNPAAIPLIPDVLLDMLQHWDDWKPCFESALGIETEPPTIAPQRPQQAEQLPGRRDPIQEFNQSNSVSDVLIRNGYKHKGRDRFIRPDSESKAPGAAIMRNCADGVERVFSHGGDVLNDGFAHDAFDCFRLLEHDGDLAKALAWNPEITKHNQRLFMQEQAKNTPQNESDLREAKPLFPLIKASELTAKPIKINWLLENIIEQGSLNLLFGEPGAGKSLFALDWAFCISAGMDWNACRTKQTDVVIIAGEGFAGMARRLKALECKYQMKAPASLYISQRPADFMDAENINWLADTIKATCPNPGLVILDTLHRNMNGDENSSQDIGRFINNVDLYLKPLGAAALIVHHSGHGQKDRSRGSSSIRAAMDGEFSATKNNDSITLACHKAKDFEALKPLSFGLKPVELTDWLDDDGEPLTSVYIELEGEAMINTKKRKLSARDEAILTSLNDAIAAHGVEPTVDIKAKFGGFDSFVGRWQKVVSIDHWRPIAYKSIVTDASKDDAKQKALKRCRDKLFNQGFIVEYDNYVWPIFSEP